MEVSGKKPNNTYAGAAEELEMLCENCEVDNVTTKAHGICRECEQNMCNMCFRTHLKTKICRHHVLIDINQIETAMQIKAENVAKCTRHVNETIKYYCRKHETVGCGDCMIPVHGPCKPENIKDLSKQFHNSEDFKSLIRNLKDVTTTNLENDKKVKENKKENQVMLDKALKDIRRFRSDINTYFDKAEASITKETRYIKRQNDKLLANLDNDCKLLSSKVTEVGQKLDKERYQNSALFIQTVDCKPRVDKIEREVSRIQREIDIRTFDFLPDKQLHELLTSIEKLGSLRRIERKSQMKPNTSLAKEVRNNKS